MERLSIEKFENNRILKKGLSDIKGGECTGGGFRTYGENKTMYYSSDELNTVTGINGGTYTRIKYIGVSFE